MKISIEIAKGEIEQEVQTLLTQKIDFEINRVLQDVLRKTNIEELIIERVNYLVDKTKYVSNDVVKNLVQQKIARVITDIIIPQP